MALTAVDGKTEYITTLGDSPTDVAAASIVCGGTGDKFVPNINASKWNDEAWLNINHGNTLVAAETEAFTNGLIELQVGNLTHRYYTDTNNRLEHEIEFASKPTSNVIEFDLSFSDNLSFHYQDKLTQKEIDDDHQRPEDVVGSYAVYFNKRHNNYKTGKFCHIYRPKFIDADKNETWANLHIDPILRKLTITVPQTWLDNAIYPITLDPNIGYEVCGGTNSGQNRLFLHKESGADGTLTGAFGCVYDADAKVAVLAIYDNSDRSLVDYTAAVTDANWDTTPVFNAVAKAVTNGAAISVAKSYDIGAAIALARVRYDNVGAGNPSYKDDDDFTGGLPNPYTRDTTYDLYNISVYFTYDVAAGGAIPLLVGGGMGQTLGSNCNLMTG